MITSFSFRVLVFLYITKKREVKGFWEKKVTHKRFYKDEIKKGKRNPLKEYTGGPKEMVLHVYLGNYH